MSFFEDFDAIARPMLDGYLGLWPLAVEVQAAALVADGYADAVPSWETVVAEWKVEIRPQNGSEPIRGADQIQPQTTYRVTGQYIEGLSQGRRLKFGDRFLYIESVLNEFEADRDLVLVCQERTE